MSRFFGFLKTIFQGMSRDDVYEEKNNSSNIEVFEVDLDESVNQTIAFGPILQVQTQELFVENNEYLEDEDYISNRICDAEEETCNNLSVSQLQITVSSPQFPFTPCSSCSCTGTTVEEYMDTTDSFSLDSDGWPNFDSSVESNLIDDGSKVLDIENVNLEYPNSIIETNAEVSALQHPPIESYNYNYKNIDSGFDSFFVPEVPDVGGTVSVIPDLLENQQNLQIWKKQNGKNLMLPGHITLIQENSGGTLYKCICTKQFRTKHHVSYHLYCTGTPKPFQCTMCNKTFALKNTCNTHIRTHGGQTFRCGVCDRKFKQKTRLNDHLKRHTSTEIRPYACNTCGNAFPNKAGLGNHVHNVHSNKLNFTRTVRPKSSSTNFSLNAHKMVHKMYLRKRAAKCDYCPAVFTRKDNAMRHMRKTHSGK